MLTLALSQGSTFLEPTPLDFGYIEDQQKHSASWTEELLDSWMLHWETAFGQLVGLWSISFCNKSPIYSFCQL